MSQKIVKDDKLSVTDLQMGCEGIFKYHESGYYKNGLTIKVAEKSGCVTYTAKITLEESSVNELRKLIGT